MIFRIKINNKINKAFKLIQNNNKINNKIIFKFKILFKIILLNNT